MPTIDINKYMSTMFWMVYRGFTYNLQNIAVIIGIYRCDFPILKYIILNLTKTSIYLALTEWKLFNLTNRKYIPAPECDKPEKQFEINRLANFVQYGQYQVLDPLSPIQRKTFCITGTWWSSTFPALLKNIKLHFRMTLRLHCCISSNRLSCPTNINFIKIIT